jgi:HSP20 family protein
MSILTHKKPKQENVVPIRSSMLEEMEHMFESMLPQKWWRHFGEEPEFRFETLPRVDVIDREDNIIVRAALPGVEKDDLEVSTTAQTVTIRGSSKKEKKEEKDEYYRCEISESNYLRTVALPATIDDSKAKATFKNGMLELKLPKLESAKRRSVKIEAD